ncbi:thioredoxin domain-containing protein [Cryomorpha ignava]|uniref:Thioredoxin domain-containing protein n=1 Tax=Cryomorpha ignava TaxID=101383 RepID=A0A7K3WQD2_9FLAO|nr:thioredoxin domain-containing protein [Cryomorpha ignava]NEN23231.1 thioredoxin domain-containing protein [Cryomorpha ignava]
MTFKKILFISFVFHFMMLSSCAQTKPQETHEKTAGSGNQLANAKSPYLQQHADNPVHWHEWNEAALAEAEARDVPLLISIGYAACHWCHVMEHESFMDTTVARWMNDNFVNIKIDREERPDIDQIYMNAAQIINGRGGWPLNAFALPDGRPYYAGTYYPKENWLEVLEQMSDAYKTQKDEVVKQADNLTSGIADQEVIRVAAVNVSEFEEADYDAIFKKWEGMIDYKKGGYSRSPKFPLPAGWEFLLQYHYLTGNEKALEAVNTTLTEMAKGGIYDQIGGGFARYSTDENWFAPHFEKMLYDNGQLVSLYANAYKLTKNEEYAEVIRQTLEFIKRELTNKDGGFYSSLNADSEGEEGIFYIWTESEIKAILNAELAGLMIDYYNVKTSGNWESGRNILYRDIENSAFAERHNLTEIQWKEMRDKANKLLLDARANKERPSTDDKVLAGWNALMLKGYIDAYLALGNEAYLDAALKNARFLEKNMLQKDGSLLRNYRNGDADIPAFLDDYSLLAESYIKLYEATFDLHWLTLAKGLADYSIAHFRNDESGMFYYTSNSSETLIARKMEIADNVIPASNSVIANVLYKLSIFYYDEDYREMCVEMLGHLQDEIESGGPYYANWALLMGQLSYGSYEVAIIGEGFLPKSMAMQKEYLPMSIFMGGEKENLPLLENKLLHGEATIFVCRERVCQLPVVEVGKALELIK